MTLPLNLWDVYVEVLIKLETKPEGGCTDATSWNEKPSPLKFVTLDNGVYNKGLDLKPIDHLIHTSNFVVSSILIYLIFQ